VSAQLVASTLAETPRALREAEATRERIADDMKETFDALHGSSSQQLVDATHIAAVAKTSTHPPQNPGVCMCARA
jgi:hypothetical protein